MSQTIIVLDGPDGCGKTQIAQGLSRVLGIPYFKMPAERENWAKGKFKEELLFGERRQLQLFKQLGMSAIIDRGHASEWVYSQVFERETDQEFIWEVDQMYAELGTQIIIPWREDYSKNRYDDLVPNDRLQDIHDKYFAFRDWTACDCIPINVDFYKNDLSAELHYLTSLLQWSKSYE